MKRAACSWIAATTVGWQCPVLVTAMPLVKSRYSVPSAVVTVHPDPDTTGRSVTWNHTSARCPPIAADYVSNPGRSVVSGRPAVHGAGSPGSNRPVPKGSRAMRSRARRSAARPGGIAPRARPLEHPRRGRLDARRGGLRPLPRVPHELLGDVQDAAGVHDEVRHVEDPRAASTSSRSGDASWLFAPPHTISQSSRSTAAWSIAPPSAHGAKTSAGRSSSSSAATTVAPVSVATDSARGAHRCPRSRRRRRRPGATARAPIPPFLHPAPSPADRAATTHPSARSPRRASRRAHRAR